MIYQLVLPRSSRGDTDRATLTLWRKPLRNTHANQMLLMELSSGFCMQTRTQNLQGICLYWGSKSNRPTPTYVHGSRVQRRVTLWKDPSSLQWRATIHLIINLRILLLEMSKFILFSVNCTKQRLYFTLWPGDRLCTECHTQIKVCRQSVTCWPRRTRNGHHYVSRHRSKIREQIQVK